MNISEDELRRQLASSGMDMDLLLAIKTKLGSGSHDSFDLPEISAYVETHPTDPDVRRFLEKADESLKRKKQENSQRIKTVDFRKLPYLQHEMWQIKLDLFSYKLTSGMHVKPDDVRRSERGAKPLYRLYCYVKIGPHMAAGDLTRWMEEFNRMPTSKEIEEFIRVSFAFPSPGYKPGYPNILVLAHSLKQHQQALTKFLNTLPPPFEWHPEPPELTGKKLSKEESVSMLDDYVSKAAVCKKAGNDAFARKDRRKAIAEYEKAIYFIDEGLYKLKSAVGLAKAHEVEKIQSIIFANCSAARMLPGPGQDPERGRDDGEEAIRLDRTYAKGYMRLSRAHEALKDIPQAQEAIAKALRTPELENNSALVDHLIDLQTGGKGLSMNMDSYAEWVQRTLKGDEVSVKIMKGVRGLWIKRIEEHAHLIPRP